MKIHNRWHKIIQFTQLKLNIHATWRLQFYFTMLINYIQRKYFFIIKMLTGAGPGAYSCSRCSGAAQMVNYLAGQLDRKVIAEMPCIAETGGNVIKLVPAAQCGRKIIAVDGCPFDCSKACMCKNMALRENYFGLLGMGTRKRQVEDFDMQEANRVLEIIKNKIPFQDKKVLSIVYSPAY